MGDRKLQNPDPVAFSTQILNPLTEVPSRPFPNRSVSDISVQRRCWKESIALEWSKTGAHQIRPFRVTIRISLSSYLSKEASYRHRRCRHCPR